MNDRLRRGVNRSLVANTWQEPDIFRGASRSCTSCRRRRILYILSFFFFRNTPHFPRALKIFTTEGTENTEALRAGFSLSLFLCDLCALCGKILRVTIRSHQFLLQLSCLLLGLASLEAQPIPVPTYFYHGFPDVRDHPGHRPYISYATFRTVCDIRIDETTEWFDPDTVKQGDIIYLNLYYLNWFVQHVHDQIKHPYILVSTDIGSWMPDPTCQKLLYDPKVAAWFCRNMVFSYHPKLFQAPMGQDLSLFGVTDPQAMQMLTDASAHKSATPQHILYMNHLPRVNTDRIALVKLFENQPYCFTRVRSDAEFVSTERPQFYADIADSQFILSPLGLETDCVRTWEALALGCIPIVEHTFLDPSYDRLPVAMVHNWKEVTLPFLEKKYEELKNRKRDEAYFDYWETLIKETQKKARANDLADAQLEATQFPLEDLQDLVALVEARPLLLYKGFLAALRPLQLAHVYTGQILLQDPWLNAETLRALGHPSTIELLSDDNSFMNQVQWNIDCSVFLDLTYYRTSLFINFGKSIVERGNFRQSLLHDLNKLYYEIRPGCLLCGNMVNNAYVKEILEFFADENDLTIERKGSFWFFTKR